MNIVVPVKLVPDLVEELVIDDQGTGLDPSSVRPILNEFDDHAIEQGILLKESGGGQVTVVAPDVEGADDVLYTAAAKGADRLVKLTGAHVGDANNHALARMYANVIKTYRPELILTGVGAHNDLDGSVGPLLAEQLGMPYVGYVAGLSVNGPLARVRKEYPGGLLAEVQVTLPAVLGIQAAKKAPRYVPVSKLRQTMKSASIEECPAPEREAADDALAVRMFAAEPAEKATMLDGEPEDVAAKLVDIFKEQGVI